MRKYEDYHVWWDSKYFCEKCEVWHNSPSRIFYKHKEFAMAIYDNITYRMCLLNEEVCGGSMAAASEAYRDGMDCRKCETYKQWKASASKGKQA